jgi:hypothetical protein
VSRPTLGPAQPPIQRVTEALFPGIKRLGCEADHSSPFSVEVKIECSYTSTTPYPFIFTFATHCVLFKVDITNFIMFLPDRSNQCVTRSSDRPFHLRRYRHHGWRCCPVRATKIRTVIGFCGFHGGYWPDDNLLRFDILHDLGWPRLRRIMPSLYSG